MVNTLKPSNYDFWSGYQQAREVIDLGSTTAKIRGVVLNENDVPLIGVEFKIVKAGTEEVVGMVMTDVKGKFNIAQLPAGMVDLRWRFSGYKDVFEANVKISAGKELKRKIVMEAEIVETQEGNLGMGMSGNIDTSGMNNPDATVQLEATGAQMNFFASNTPAGGAAGGVVSVQPGMPAVMKLSQFLAAIGFGGMNGFVKVQNVGMMPGSWKLIING